MVTGIFMNYGIIEGQRGTDWLAGTLPYEERNPTGNWTPYLPPGEWQRIDNTDVMACVTFAELNSVETQLKFYGKTVNLSDRFTAKMSGTTQMGNFLYLVGDSIRKTGVVLESDWPAPDNVTWDSYYSNIPSDVYEKRIQYNIRYEFLPTPFTRDDLKYHLRHCPLVVTIPGHAVLLFASDEDVDRYFDSYSPFKKRWTNPFVSAMKLVYYEQATDTPMTPSEVTKLYVLAFYREPDATELAYWTGKPLRDFLATAIKDRAAFLKSHE